MEAGLEAGNDARRAGEVRMAILLSMVPIIAAVACGLGFVWAVRDAPGLAVAASSFAVAMAGSGARRLVTDPDTLRRTPFAGWVLASVVEVGGILLSGWGTGGALGDPDLRLGGACLAVALAALAADAWQASFVDVGIRASLVRGTFHRDLLDRKGIVADPPYRAKVVMAYAYLSVVAVALATATWEMATLASIG